MAYFAISQSHSAPGKIFAPSSDVVNDDAASQTAQTKDDPIQGECKNFLHYGSCKFERNGCVYSHPSRTDASLSASPPEVPSTSTLSGQAVYAPPFVPQAISRIASPKPKSLTSPPPSMSNNAYHDHDLYDPYAYHGSNGEIHPEYVNGTETYHQALQPTFVRQSDSRAYCEPLLPPLHWSPPPPLPPSNSWIYRSVRSILDDPRTYAALDM